VRAQSDDGVSYGPPSSAHQPIFSAPTFNTFAYDGNNGIGVVGADGSLTGSFAIKGQGFYRIELTGPHGEKVEATLLCLSSEPVDLVLFACEVYPLSCPILLSSLHRLFTEHTLGGVAPQAKG